MEYSRTERQEFANGVNIIHFPNLTEDERAARQMHLKKVAENFMKEIEKEKRADGQKSDN